LVTQNVLDEGANTDTPRETFFMNQLFVNQKVSAPKAGDFLVNDVFTFEVKKDRLWTSRYISLKADNRSPTVKTRSSNFTPSQTGQ